MTELNTTQLKEAMFYEKKDSNIKCNLCYRRCVIADGKAGVCTVRKNISGKLYALTYGKAAAYGVDPIEKKPFYHFWPGSSTFSFCTVGCNLKCLGCCNPHLSKIEPGKVPEFDIPPKKIVEMARDEGSNIISYTYTEPTIFFEYAYDTGVLARKSGMLNTFVTNGYATPEAVKKSKDFLDAARIDLKGDEEHYKKVCGGVVLENVLECIKNYHKTSMHVEIITLVIPEDNDNKDFVVRMADFLEGMSDEIPWHFLQFFPSYKMMDRPVTPTITLEKMRAWAMEEGMKYVYVGNIPGHPAENTYCPDCGNLLIERSGFSVAAIELSDDKRCLNCGAKIPITGELSEIKRNLGLSE